jgi:hypothetical protein
MQSIDLRGSVGCRAVIGSGFVGTSDAGLELMMLIMISCYVVWSTNKCYEGLKRNTPKMH